MTNCKFYHNYKKANRLRATFIKQNGMKNLYLLVSVIALLSIHMALSAQNSLVLYSTALPADLGPKGKHLVSQSKVVNIPIIYHHEIDPGNTGKVDYSLVSQAIETRIPGRE